MKITTYQDVAHITIDPADIDNWLRDKASDETKFEYGWPNDVELQTDYTLSLFTECSPTVRGQMELFGLRIDDGKILIVTHNDDDLVGWIKHQFEGIQAIANLVSCSYDNSAPNQCGWGPMLPDLSGDDDVDYSGSYISTGASLIIDYLEAQ